MGRILCYLETERALEVWLEDFDEKSLELIRAEFSDALLQILLSSGKARRHCEGYFTFSQPISFDLLMSQKLTAELGDTLPDAGESHLDFDKVF